MTDNKMPDDVNENIIELTDEETGETILFEHLDTIEYEEKQYFIMTEYFEDEQQEDDVYIMTITTDDDGEETLEIVEDDATVFAVFEEFKNRCGDQFEFID